MPTDGFLDDTLILRNREIPVKLGHLRQADLRFYPENPRVYSIVCSNGQDPTQGEIERTLVEMEHVKQLRNSIKLNGGLTDPVLVRDKSFVVLEGNSRLAAYRLLAQKDPIKWDLIKCKVYRSQSAMTKCSRCWVNTTSLAERTGFLTNRRDIFIDDTSVTK